MTIYIICTDLARVCGLDTYTAIRCRSSKFEAGRQTDGSEVRDMGSRGEAESIGKSAAFYKPGARRRARWPDGALGFSGEMSRISKAYKAHSATR